MAKELCFVTERLLFVKESEVPALYGKMRRIYRYALW